MCIRDRSDLTWSTWPYPLTQYQDPRVSLKEIVTFDTTGKYSHLKPRHSTLSLVHAQKCHAIHHQLKKPQPIKVQATYINPYTWIDIYQCIVKISYTQHWCGWNGIAYDIEGGSTVLEPTVINLGEQGCRDLYNKKTLMFKLYNTTKSHKPQIDSIVLASDIPHGWHLAETEVAGTSFSDDSCTGERFEFYEQTFDRNILKRTLETTVTKHRGKHFEETDTIYLRNVANLPKGKESTFDTIHGNLVTSKPVVQNKCKRVTELFTGKGTIHHKSNSSSNIGDLIFVKNDEHRQTAFVITNSSTLCGSKAFHTTINNVYLIPITKENRFLQTIPKTESDPDLLAEFKHEFVASQATLETDFDNAIVNFEEQNCINSLDSQTNTLLTLRAASDETLANLFHGFTARKIGSAISITQGIPIAAWIRDHRPSAGTDQACCLELPVSILFNNSKVDLFAHSVSRVLTPRCSPVHCGTGHPIMHALTSSLATNTALRANKSIPWQTMSELDDHPTHSRFICDYGQGLNNCEHPTELKPMDTTKTKYSGLDAIEDSFMATLWNSTTEAVNYRIQAAQSDNIAGQAETQTIASGLQITTPVLKDRMKNIPPTAVHAAWSSAFASFIPDFEGFGEFLSYAVPGILTFVGISILGTVVWVIITTCVNLKQLIKTCIDLPKSAFTFLKRKLTKPKPLNHFEMQQHTEEQVVIHNIEDTVASHTARIRTAFQNISDATAEIEHLKATLLDLTDQMNIIERHCTEIRNLFHTK